MALLACSTAHSQTLAAPASVTFSPLSVRGGYNATGVVTLNQAVSVATNVSLTAVAGQAAIKNFPSVVTVPAGSNRVVFGVATQPTSTAVAIQIRAALGTATSTGSFSALPPAAAPIPSGITYAANPLGSGASTTGTLILDYPAPSDLSVRMQILTGGQYLTSFPTSVTVPAGATSVQFPVTGAAVSTSVQANTWAFANGAVVTQVLTVQPGGGSTTPPPPPPPPTSGTGPARVSLLPRIVPAAGNVTGVVTLNQPAAAATPVALQAVAGAEAVQALPASVTVPAGAQSASFTLVTKLVLVRTAISIQASANGGAAVGSVTVASPFDDIAIEPSLPRVLLIGDSISIGYTFPVRGLLEGRANVFRVPENSSTTYLGIARIDGWLAGGNYDVIHFNFGLHDMRVMPDGKNQVPLPEYEANLRTLVQKMKATGARVIFSSTTPIPNGTYWANTGNPLVVSYNSVARKVMQEYGVTYLDLYSEMLPFQSVYQPTADVHFTTEGSQFLGTRVASGIKAALDAAGK